MKSTIVLSLAAAQEENKRLTRENGQLREALVQQERDWLAAVGAGNPVAQHPEREGESG